MYYTNPILNILAEDFKVTYQAASHVPTLAQAGYAAGLLFLNPLGDLLKRRPFVLVLILFTSALWIVLCVTTNFAIFEAITFITGVTTVTPQIMIPLVGDLAPKERRATALSIVVSCLMLGILIARLLSGIVTLYIGWRYIYWIAFGLQCFIFILLWLFMPDYPSTNPESSMRIYPRLLWDVVRLFFKYPVLAQSCIVGLLSSSIFTSYWTTLTFLLAGAPYHYNSLVIGLFALIGIATMSWGPPFARLVIDKHQPLLSAIFGNVLCLVGVIIGTFVGLHNVAGPIIEAILIDVGMQTCQIANRTAIFGVEPKGRNRVNTVYMVSIFCGQLMGTAVGNELYAQGGWIRAGYASIGFICASLGFCLIRGPHETNWIGWHGGFNMKIDHRHSSDEAPPSPSSTAEEEGSAEKHD